ncbi:MAG: hypothetical protein BWY76_02356 [bacterium ADurb.Bin429]|nr:MAG: hypothetical protein BWY76_02356 [bacterium ADurb.Bin429]
MELSALPSGSITPLMSWFGPLAASGKAPCRGQAPLRAFTCAGARSIGALRPSAAQCGQRVHGAKRSLRRKRIAALPVSELKAALYAKVTSPGLYRLPDAGST